MGAVILQRDRIVRKGRDIRRLLERRMEMWLDEKYDLLVQEADRCNISLRVSKGSFDDDVVARIFSRLML